MATATTRGDDFKNLATSVRASEFPASHQKVKKATWQRPFFDKNKKLAKKKIMKTIFAAYLLSVTGQLPFIYLLSSHSIDESVFDFAFWLVALF